MYELSESVQQFPFAWFMTGPGALKVVMKDAAIVSEAGAVLTNEVAYFSANINLSSIQRNVATKRTVDNIIFNASYIRLWRVKLWTIL